MYCASKFSEPRCSAELLNPARRPNRPAASWRPAVAVNSRWFPLSCSALYPPDAEKSSVGLPTACFVTRLTAPPIASASMSGVSAFVTSIDWSWSAGTASSWIWRTSPSGAGIRSPSISIELRRGSVPRIRT